MTWFELLKTLHFLIYWFLMTAILFGLLRHIARNDPISIRRFGLLAFIGVFSALFLSLGRLQVAAPALAWVGGAFWLGSAILIGRQRINERRRRVFATCLLLIGIVYLGFGIDGLLIEPTALTVKRLEIRTPKITKPIRVVFLTDLQTDTIGDYERRTLRSVQQQRADLILFGGDYLQSLSLKQERQLREDFHRLLREIDLDAPLGVYAVPGNQELGNWLPWTDYWEGTKIQTVRNTKTLALGEIRVTLLGVRASFALQRFPVSVEDRNRFRIIVGHAPRFALAEQTADLLLAGHTHGGQIWIPGFGPILTMTKDLPRKWASGATRMKNGGLLIVSNGTGLERGRAPRVRLFCRPDFWVIDLVPENGAHQNDLPQADRTEPNPLPPDPTNQENDAK